MLVKPDELDGVLAVIRGEATEYTDFRVTAVLSGRQPFPLPYVKLREVSGTMLATVRRHAVTAIPMAYKVRPPGCPTLSPHP